MSSFDILPDAIKSVWMKPEVRFLAMTTIEGFLRSEGVRDVADMLVEDDVPAFLLLLSAGLAASAALEANVPAADAVAAVRELPELPPIVDFNDTEETI